MALADEYPRESTRARGVNTAALRARRIVRRGTWWSGLAGVLALSALPLVGSAADDTSVPDAVIGGSLRVIGGAVASQDQWPSIVALVRVGRGSPADRQFCGGTVIAPRWVMTAAHCLYDLFKRQIEPSSLRVITGVSDLRADTPDEEAIVTNLFVHPSYDHVAQDAYDDIALIELANPVAAPAIDLFAGDTESLARGRGFIAGWGATEFITPRRATYPDALHEAVVPLVPRAVCNAPLSYAGYVGAGQLCAGFAEGGVDTCVGDSGGPLVVDIGGRLEQVGVVSYGRGCAVPLFYGIYTNVSAYRSWISEFVALPEPVTPPVASELPRGPADGSTAPIALTAPVARPVEGVANPFEPIASNSASDAPDRDESRFLFGGVGATTPLAGIALLLFALRRRAIRRR